MHKIIISLTTVIALTSTSFAGGKYVAPVDAGVIPLPVEEVAINSLPIYVGLGLIAAGVSRDCQCSGDDRLKDTTYGGIIRAGWDINQYVGIEARALKASWEEDFSTTKHYGLYLKPQYHVSPQTNVYGLLGYGKTEITGCSYADGTLSESGFSYGAGLEYDFGSDESEGQYSRNFDGQGDQEKGWGMWVDFQHLLYNEGIFNTKSNIATAGITYDF